MRIFNSRVVRFCGWVLLASLAIVSIVTSPRAQQPTTTPQPSEDRIALHQALLDLTNPWTVMCIAAHPDDEDGTSLIVMRRKYGAHAVSLFSTFGEGGQNAIGPELYEELGAIRARETMAASEIQGSEPHFLGLVDFGFSKSREETFQKWGHEEALRRMVFQIRTLRPDVIITNHSTTSNDHGHHQATARLIVEAFDAAADPKQFPDQLKDGVTTWQVQRLFVRVRGSQPVQNPDRQGGGQQIVTIDPNERDPVRGTVFAEQALSALQKHATQGPWPKNFAEFTARFRSFSGQSGATGQMPLIRYRIEREAKGAGVVPKEPRNFLDGLGLTGPPTIEGRPLTEFVSDRGRLLDALVDVRKSGRFDPAKSHDASRSKRMNDRLDRAFSAVTNISAKTTPRDQIVVPGQPTKFTVTIANNGDFSPSIYSVTFFAGRRSIKTLYSGSSPFPPKDSGSVTDEWTIPKDTIPSLPHEAHLYDGREFGDEFSEVVKLNLKDIQFSVVATTRVDVARPLEIADISPSPLVVMRPRVGVSSAGADILPATNPKITVKLANHMNRTFKGELAFGHENRSPENRRKIEIPAHETTALTVTLPVDDPSRAAHQSVSGLADNAWFSLRNTGLHDNLIKRAVPIVWVDARVDRNVRVGYVRGFDFSLPKALDALGVEAKELTVDEVKTADLSKFTSIIIEHRIYQSKPELIVANQKLLDYANAGGNLIVFYHQADEFNPNPERNRPQLAPYNLILGNQRITDENAPITFLEPEHPLLNVPNKLNQEDFKGWIQERGLYYPREWDPQFKALLQSNDPNEQPLKGGLLVADYGKGHYIYTSMVWYRQLRAGVPGAYRMLANMVSYGRPGN